jgi:hypothetical protein
MSDARHIEEIERRCNLLEQVVLIQEKRVWSQDMLKELEQGHFMPGADAQAKTRTRQLLEGNLRVSMEILDRLAVDLGYENRSVFKLLDPEFVYGAPGTEVGDELRTQLERVDTREREAGTSHLSALMRDLKTRHDAFLGDVQERVREDVDLHAIFSQLVNGPS